MSPVSLGEKGDGRAKARRRKTKARNLVFENGTIRTHKMRTVVAIICKREGVLLANPIRIVIR